MTKNTQVDSKQYALISSRIKALDSAAVSTQNAKAMLASEIEKWSCICGGWGCCILILLSFAATITFLFFRRTSYVPPPNLPVPPAMAGDVAKTGTKLQGETIHPFTKQRFLHECSQFKDMKLTLLTEPRGWERVTGRLLEDDVDSESRKACNKTITADCWTEKPLDWRKQITGRRGAPQKESSKSMLGLGHWNIKKSGTACVLLGGKTPFILRTCENGATKGRVNEKKPEKGACYKVVGEAYTSGCMYYEGSMEDDIKSGNVVPTWFHLL